MLLELLNKHKWEPITEAKTHLYDEGKWQKSQQSLLQQVLCPVKMAHDLNKCKQCNWYSYAVYRRSYKWITLLLTIKEISFNFPFLFIQMNIYQSLSLNLFFKVNKDSISLKVMKQLSNWCFGYPFTSLMHDRYLKSPVDDITWDSKYCDLCLQ